MAKLDFVPRSEDEKTFYQHMGERIRFARQVKHLSLHALAGKANIGYVTLSLMEAGRTRSTIHIVVRIARALGVSLSRLVGERGG